MTNKSRKISALKTVRKDFIKGVLMEDEIFKNPMAQFECWLNFAFKSGNEHANAVALSTVGSDNVPDSRIVLLRDISYNGFTFFTNYQSKKARDLETNSNASLLFFWPELERQVRIQGEIKFLPAIESDNYFETRPFESQVGAWVSLQSSVIKSRMEMENIFQKEIKNYENKKVPRPLNWGGYVLIPFNFEFWQGRANRLHDRICYTLDKNSGKWIIERLMP